MKNDFFADNQKVRGNVALRKAVTLVEVIIMSNVYYFSRITCTF